MTDVEVLTPREATLIAAIVAAPGDTQEDIAKALRISKRHVRRLLSRAHVRRALDEASRACLSEAASLLARGATRAGEVLIAMTIGATRATSARVAAAKAVIAGANETVDLVDLEKRIVAMERSRGSAGWPAGGRPQ